MAVGTHEPGLEGNRVAKAPDADGQVPDRAEMTLPWHPARLQVALPADRSVSLDFGPPGHLTLQRLIIMF